MANNPEPMIGAARSFLMKRHRPPALPDRERWFEQLLEGFFRNISEQYNSDSMLALNAWLPRHFASREELRTWWLWSILLPRLARLYGGDVHEPNPLSAAHTEIFGDAVGSQFSAEVREADRARLEAASRIPLDSEEARLVALEVTSPNDSQEMDMVGALNIAIQSEQAFRTWRMLLNSGQGETPIHTGVITPAEM
jgi:hypothetical protein